jgi:hypothetical protein
MERDTRVKKWKSGNVEEVEKFVRLQASEIRDLEKQRARRGGIVSTAGAFQYRTAEMVSRRHPANTCCTAKGYNPLASSRVEGLECHRDRF